MSSPPAKICMNGLCGATTTPQWKRGWPMKSGGFATLCYSCGMAYDNLNYCERFHLNEPGWRECKFCDKPIHCGCVVSKYLHECLDLGGISCAKCLRAKVTLPVKQSNANGIPNGFTPFSSSGHSSVIGNRVNGGASFDKGKLTQLSEALEKHKHPSSASSIGHQFRPAENRLPSGEFGMAFSSSKDVGANAIVPYASPIASISDTSRPNLGLKAMYEALPHQSSGFSLGSGLSPPTSSVLPISSGVVEGGRVQEKVPSFKQGQRSRFTLPKPSKSGVSIRSQLNNGTGSENRVARPPVEGRGRSQLLPRYWPKITEQELLQISGDLNSNCTITPLFEKVLSASDAGRIGRLVLPKACAEAYFPPIHQSDGLPIRIQDIKGKEWTFQFRFWPNNNSRMYVLEGVTPCIQNMQMQAGDTVIFSRLNPGDKLVIGCRKAAISADTQDTETSALPNGVHGGTPINLGNENPALKNVDHEDMTNWESMQRPEKKKSRNIGSKSKRLLMHSEDAIELKVTWEEAQEFLRPPTSKPTVVTVDNCEIEEYNEPPVFAKKTIFTMTATGLVDQWGQCDSCSKWRKLPSDVLLPPKWTCSDNVWDPNRCSCSAPDEIRVGDLERILRFSKEPKRRKLAETKVEEQQQEPSGLDALATAAVLGESVAEFGESSVGPTTRHPRHRAGCTCIVCIQPPSGKGKHKPDCICNVCMTVKRRFRTLMLRKKKRQSLREAETARKSPSPPLVDETENGAGLEAEAGESSSNKGGQQQLDLNCDPNNKEEEMMLAEAAESLRVANGGGKWRNVVEGLVPCSSEIKGGRPAADADEDEGGCPKAMDE